MQINVDQALQLGYIVEYDENGRMIYIDQEGRIVDPETGSVTVYPVSSVGESAGTDWTAKISGILTKGLSFAQAWQQQKAFNEANKQRAAQGLPPLPWTEFRPTASVGVTLDPKILWTIGIVGGMLALSVLMGKRR
jgi:hypothetical protein